MRCYDLNSLSGHRQSPQSIQSLFGPKIAGYSQLMNVQAGCPIPFLIPSPSWAISPQPLKSNLPHVNLKDCFDSLTWELTHSALMVRGAPLNELPGQSRSYALSFDRANKEKCYQRFEETVRNVLDADPFGRALCSPMVGQTTLLPGGVCAFGFGNVSFVANTHSATQPEEMHIDVVHGWGTRAVAAGSDALLIDIDRETGLISSFINRTEAAIRTRHLGVETIDDFLDYRQRTIDFFNLKTGLAEERKINAELAARLGLELYISASCQPAKVVSGRMTRDPDDVAESDHQLYEKKYGRRQNMEIGLNPFQDLLMLSRLIGLLQYLAKRFGPVEIEGAFSQSHHSSLHLYQVTPTTLPPREYRSLSIDRPQISSQKVLGVARFSGPLIFDPEGRLRNKIDLLERLDRRYGSRGYVLLTTQHVNLIIEATQHCRLRLSTGLENYGSHPVALTRLKMHQQWPEIQRNPERGYVQASDVQILRDQIPPSDEVIHGISIFDKVKLDANGQEVAVRI